MVNLPKEYDSDPELAPEVLIKRFGRDMVRDFDIDSPELNEHFGEVIDFLVEKCPVVHSKVGTGYYVFNTEEAVRAAGQDWETFSSAKGFVPNRPADQPYLIPVEQDPPDHTKWRQKINPHMGPKVMTAVREKVRADVGVLMDKFIDAKECEFISQLAAVLPGWAFFRHILGVPTEDLGRLVYGVERSLFGPKENRTAHYQDVFVYLDAFMKRRAEMPKQGDIVDMILEGVVYENGEEASWDHKISVVADLTYGGISTTIYALGSMIYYLAENPDQRALLVSRPELIPNAIEEFVRTYSPVVAMGRSCTRDVELGGISLKKGDFVMLGFAAASRDPRVIEDPKRLNFESPTLQHSTFGNGPHRCVGSHLARMELAVFLGEWLKRIPNFRVKPGTKPTYETGFLRAMGSLHIEW